jgi:NAD(P)-dependent dehydrogenase (short-subunit alcohol dehydrogenase family)
MDATLAIDLSSTFHTTRAALPMMKARSWARIVNIASAHALVASPYKAAYVAAKHGLLRLTKVIALEVAEQGITCNAICPGYVQTPLVQGQIEDTARARGISKEAVMRDVLLAAQPTKRVRAARTGDRLRGLPRRRCGRLDHRLRAAHRRWLDGAVSRASQTARSTNQRAPPRIDYLK